MTRGYGDGLVRRVTWSSLCSWTAKLKRNGAFFGFVALRRALTNVFVLQERHMSSRRAQPPKGKIAKVKSEESVPVATTGVSPKRPRTDPVRTVHLQAPLFPPGRTFITYTMTNAPALAYDVALMLDKGFEPRKWTASRLKVTGGQLQRLSTVMCDKRAYCCPG